jgi:hypothetical protein
MLLKTLSIFLLMKVNLLFFLTTMSYKDFLKKRDIITDIYDVHGSKNVEHVIPKNIKQYPYGSYCRDLHFVYNSNKELNNWRSNFTFDKIKNKDNIELFNKNPEIQKDKNNNIFLPPPCSRGIIARTCAYFVYKYPYYKRCFEKIINPETLVEWNYYYPVSMDEYHRNVMVSVESEDGDRNIFIDNEYLVYEFINENFDVNIKKYLDKAKGYSILEKLSLYWE